MTEKLPFFQFLSIVGSAILCVFLCTPTAHGASPLRVRGDNDFPPFEFLDHRGEPSGFNVDIMRALANTMGLEIQIELGPWHEVRREIEQGKADILMGMSRSEERDALVDFSIPHFMSSFAVFVPNGSDISSIDQIGATEVIVQDGGTGHDYLLRENLAERILPVATVANALVLLDSGIGDCALLPRLQAMAVVHGRGLEGVVPVGEPILQRGYCFAVPEGRSDLVAILNEGLSILEDSGEYDAIYEKWLGVYESGPPHYRWMVRLGLLVLVVLAGVLAVVSLWSRILKKQVSRATKELRESRENLRITLYSMWEGVLTTDKEGLITGMNMVAGSLTGWPRTEVPGRHIDGVFQTLDVVDRRPSPACIPEVLATGRAVERASSTLLVAKDGTEHYIAHTTAPIRDDTGVIHGIVIVFRDISEPYRIREALQRSEERFQLAMEASRDGIWDWNIMTGETYYSPGYAAILGYASTEVPAHVESWKDLIHPSDRDDAFRANQACIEGRCDDFSVEFRMRAKDGQWRWILGRGKAVARDADGRATRMVGTHTEITAIKEASEALTAQNRRHTTLLGNLNGMAYRCLNDKDWTMEFISRGCLDLTGYPVTDIKKNSRLSYNDLILPAYRERVWTQCQKKLQNHEPFEIEYEITTASGKNKWVWEKGCGVFDDKGKLQHLEGFVTDITERKRMEQALEKRIVALTQPFDQTGDIVFEDLFNLEEMQQLQDEFSEATGLASLICRPDGTPLTRPSNFTRLCAGIIRGTDMGKCNCEKSDALVGRVNPDGPIIVQCASCGLWDAGTSISVGGLHVASWLIGQVRDESQSEEQMRAYARKIGGDEEETVRAFREVPAMSRERFAKIAHMLFTLANRLSTTAYINVQQARFIAERNTALEKLHQSEENLRTTLDSIGDGVIATDTGGRVTRMNPVAEDLTGWGMEEAWGEPLHRVFSIINADTRKPVDSPVEKVLATSSIVGLANHTVLVARDGSEYQIADSGAPIRSDSGEILGVVLVFRDVSKESILQEQLRQSRKMDAIGQLAGGVAHDFNNMLSGIMGAAELLETKENIPIEDRDRYLDLILQSAIRAKDLTSKLLAFGRKEKMTAAPVDIHTLVEDTVAITARTMDKRIKTNVVAREDNAWVHGDASTLQNALINLVLNAGQAMPEGGELHIGTRNRNVDGDYSVESPFDLRPGNHVEITVTDTGTGIPPGDLQRIFEPFFTTKTAGKGTGLGLAAVYGTIRSHHGEITVSSGVGTGTTFQILLPCVKPPDTTRAKEQPVITGTETVLLVDDEESIRVTEKMLLEDMGYSVVCASDGRQAVEVFRANHREIDVVVMDMRMPEMDGLEALERMKEIDPDCRVIIVSGFTNNGTLEESHHNGVAGFLRKPYRISELSALMAKVLHAR
ncbi:PAS domain S-box protein [Desulfoplanes sp.]